MTKAHYFFLSVLIFCGINFSIAQEESAVTIGFKNVNSQNIRDAFEKATKGYPFLKDVEITVKTSKIKDATMQAQPVMRLNSLWKGITKFQIKLSAYVKDAPDQRVEDLPQEILVGWFAHELGHIADYQSRSGWEMIKFGIKYVTNGEFKREVEHSADFVAIANGFHEEIIAAKKFILDNEQLDEAYKRKIRTYYMSIDQVERCMHDDEVLYPFSRL